MQMKATMQWPTPLLELTNPNHGQIKSSLIDHCYAIERRAAEAGAANADKAPVFESRPDLFKPGETPEVLAVRQFVVDALSQSFIHLFKIRNPEVPPPGHITIDLSESWVQLMRDGGYADARYNANCSWCGLYYVDVGESSAADPANGVDRFFPPMGMGYEDLGSMAYRQSPINVTPEDGKLILFPSYLQHSAVPYRGKKDRIVIAFNTRIFQRAPAAQPSPQPVSQ